MKTADSPRRPPRLSFFPAVVYWLRSQEDLHDGIPLLQCKGGMKYMSTTELFFAILNVLGLLLTVYFGMKSQK